MIKVDENYYYLDLDALGNELEKDFNLAEGSIIETEEIVTKDDKQAVVETITTTVSKHKPKEIDGFKYEILRSMIEMLMTIEMEYDDALMKHKKLSEYPPNYALAFNTLLKMKILKKI